MPSISFRSACCTPSPETSRVIDGLSLFARDLVDLVDVDDAALRLLDVVVALLQQLLDDVLDVLADVAGFRERGRVRDHERDVRAGARASARGASCPSPSGPISRMFDFASSTSSCLPPVFRRL